MQTFGEIGVPEVKYSPGPQMNCSPMNKNSVDENIVPPSISNAFKLFFIIVGLLAWFFMNIICLSEPKTHHGFVVNESILIITNVQNQTIFLLPMIFVQRNIGLIFWLALSGPTYFLILLKTLGSPIMSKIWTLIGHIICAVMVASAIWRMSFTIMDLYTILYYGVAFVSYFMIEPYRLAETFRKISAAVFFFPTMHLFGFAAITMCFSIFIITLMCFYIMDNTLSGIFCLIGGMYLILLISSFATILIAECVSTWYRSENKEELSGCIVLKNIFNIAREHGETIMIYCTVILPVTTLIYNCCTRIISPSSKSGSKSFSVKILTGISPINTAFCGVFCGICIVFIEISKITSLGGVITFFPHDTARNEGLMTKEDMYYGLGIYNFALAYPTVAVGVCLHILTMKKNTMTKLPLEDSKKEETVEQAMTQNQNSAQEHCEEGRIQIS